MLTVQTAVTVQRRSETYCNSPTTFNSFIEAMFHFSRVCLAAESYSTTHQLFAVSDRRYTTHDNI